MVGLATAATVIASQATISGAYSMTQQAIQLGYLPRMAIRHTSASTMGQIYIPAVNWILLVVVIIAVVGFRLVVAPCERLRRRRDGHDADYHASDLLRDPLRLALPAAALRGRHRFFAAVDLTFLAAALHKLFEGGWLPLALATVIFTIMVTWRRGRELLVEQLRDVVACRWWPSSSRSSSRRRTSCQGPPYSCTSTPDVTPHALLHSLKHYKVLHERNVFLTVDFHDRPWLDRGEPSLRRPGQRMLACRRALRLHGSARRRARAGAVRAPRHARSNRWRCPIFCRARRSWPGEGGHGMARWRDRIFAAMARNAGSATDFFNIPTNRVVELGTRIEI